MRRPRHGPRNRHIAAKHGNKITTGLRLSGPTELAEWPPKPSRPSRPHPRLAKADAKLAGALRQARFRRHCCPATAAFPPARIADAAQLPARRRQPARARRRPRCRWFRRAKTGASCASPSSTRTCRSWSIRSPRTVAAHGLSIDRLVHPVLAVRRDADGRLTGLPDRKSPGEARESMIYIETPRTDARQRRDLDESPDARRSATCAPRWPTGRRCAPRSLDDAARIGTTRRRGSCCAGSTSGMLTQLGHVTRQRDGSQSEMLGICRKSARDDAGRCQLRARVRVVRQSRGGRAHQAPLIIKANRLSNVHRRVPLDLFIVPVIRRRADRPRCRSTPGSGPAPRWPPRPTACRCCAPASRALNDKFGFDPHGHAGKSLVHALTALPHDLVIGFSDAGYRAGRDRDDGPGRSPAAAAGAGRRAAQPPPVRFRLAAARHAVDASARAASRRCSRKRTGAKALDWSLQVEGGNLALLRFVLDYPRTQRHRSTTSGIERRSQAMLRGWNEAVESRARRATRNRRAPRRSPRAMPRHSRRLSHRIRPGRGGARHPPDAPPVHRRSRQRAAARARRPALPRRGRSAPAQLRLKVYQRQGTLALSDAVPVLENFGFRVLDEVPTALEAADPASGRLATIHDFPLDWPKAAPIPTRCWRAPPRVETAIAAVLNGLGRGRSVQPPDRRHRARRRARPTGCARSTATCARPAWPVHDLHRGRCAAPRAGGRRARWSRCSSRATIPTSPATATPRRTKPMRAIRRGLAKVAAINDDRLLRLYHATDRRDPADQRLCPRSARGARLQARFGARPRPAQAGAVARDLRLFAPGRRHPPARRARSPAAACAGPTGATTSAPKCSA